MFVVCVAGQYFGHGYWRKVFSFSTEYHPDFLWIIGGLFVLSVLPALTLVLALAATAGGVMKMKSRTAIRTLALLSALFFVIMIAGTRGEGALILMFLVLPLMVVHVGSSLGFAATFDASKKG